MLDIVQYLGMMDIYCISTSKELTIVLFKKSVWDTGDVHIGFSWGNMRERNDLKNLGVDGLY
jgi:hypothetical protein